MCHVQEALEAAEVCRWLVHILGPSTVRELPDVIKHPLPPQFMCFVQEGGGRGVPQARAHFGPLHCLCMCSLFNKVHTTT